QRAGAAGGEVSWQQHRLWVHPFIYAGRAQPRRGLVVDCHCFATRHADIRSFLRMPERFRAPAGSQAIVAAQVAGRQFQTAVSDITIGLGSDARIAFVITSSAVIDEFFMKTESWNLRTELV